MDNLTVDLTCSDEVGYWTAVIETDGEHKEVIVSDKSEYTDVFPVEYDNTVTWSASNDIYPDGFWIGYDVTNMVLVDTSPCGTPIIYPNPDQGKPIIVLPPPVPPDTSIDIPPDNNLLLIFLFIVAASMILINRKD